MIRHAILSIVLISIAPLFSSPTLHAGEPDRGAIRAKMAKVMGPLPPADHIVPLDPKVVSEEKLDGYTRKKVTFAVEKADRVPAWLLIPDGVTADKKAPAMLCLHQTTDIGKDEPIGKGGMDLHYALELVKRGYVCIAPDYPGFNEYPYDFGGAAARAEFLSGSIKAVWNNMRTVDFLQTLPEVDGERIGVIGHSLGGHNTMFTAAFDERLKVIVSSCGFTSFAKYFGGKLGPWTSPRYMPRILSADIQCDASKMPFEFSDVVCSFAPRPFFANAPIGDGNFDVTGVDDVIAVAAPVYKAMGKPENLKVLHPKCGHEFPPECRQAAYDFIDSHLKPK
jgi:dienelactone hydrolase